MAVSPKGTPDVATPLHVYSVSRQDVREIILKGDSLLNDNNNKRDLSTCVYVNMFWGVYVRGSVGECGSACVRACVRVCVSVYMCV